MAIEDALHISLEARAENVSAARRALDELAQDLGMEEPGLGDLRTIVSEACSNVVRHAYPDEPGNFEVEAFPREGELTVIVRDFGCGVSPRIDPDPSSLRLGLGLISMLSSHFEIRGRGGGGTEVRMRLPLGP